MGEHIFHLQKAAQSLGLVRAGAAEGTSVISKGLQQQVLPAAAVVSTPPLVSGCRRECLPKKRG